MSVGGVSSSAFLGSRNVLRAGGERKAQWRADKSHCVLRSRREGRFLRERESLSFRDAAKEERPTEQTLDGESTFWGLKKDE